MHINILGRGCRPTTWMYIILLLYSSYIAGSHACSIELFVDCTRQRDPPSPPLPPKGYPIDISIGFRGGADTPGGWARSQRGRNNHSK